MVGLVVEPFTTRTRWVGAGDVGLGARVVAHSAVENRMLCNAS
jgi:hypothetical protein